MSGERLRVAILEDPSLVRDGLVALLGQRGFEVMIATGDPTEFLACVEQCAPDVGLVAWRLRAGAESTLRQATGLRPRTRYWVLCAGWDGPAREAAVTAGAVGFVNELSDTFDHLVASIREGLPSPVGSVDPPQQRLSRLSSRERQVLGYVASGADNLKIAAYLGITERTVKAHVQAIYRKLESESRVQIALFAVRCGVAAVSA
jgi:two-component system nitrate/nitrite response regulator NarL